MFEDITLERTLAELKAQLPPGINVMEGSWYDTELRAVALMHVEGVRAMSAILPIAFPDETAGPYIDQRAKDYGLYRKQGTRATVTVTFSCADSDGVVIPAGTAVCTVTGLCYLTDVDVAVASDAAIVTATAQTVGSTYNQPAAAIVRLRENCPAQVTAITSTEATGGSDAETDAAFYARLKVRLSQAATGENVYSYREWAMSAPGVTAVKVWPRRYGRGTVDVLVLSGDCAPASGDLIAAVAAKIERERPVGSDVTVSAPTPVSITVAATITPGAGQTVEAITAKAALLIEDYLRGLIVKDYAEISGDPAVVSQSYTVVAAIIGSFLLDAGATDFTGLTLNGSAANLTIDADEIPTLGGVSLAAAD